MDLVHFLKKAKKNNSRYTVGKDLNNNPRSLIFVIEHVLDFQVAQDLKHRPCYRSERELEKIFRAASCSIHKETEPTRLGPMQNLFKIWVLR